MGFKRLHEIHLNRNAAGRQRVRNRHPPPTGAARAIPFRDGTLAARGPAICPMHGGVLVVLRCPTTPVVEVVDHRKDVAGGSSDINRTPDTDSAGLGRSEDEDSRDQESGDDNKFQDHGSL